MTAIGKYVFRPIVEVTAGGTMFFKSRSNSTVSFTQDTLPTNLVLLAIHLIEQGMGKQEVAQALKLADKHNGNGHALFGIAQYGAIHDMIVPDTEK